MAKHRAKSNRERQQDYRAQIYSDPEKYEGYKKKERERWQKRKAAKSQIQMTEREKRSQRKKWREAQRRSREKAKVCQSFENSEASFSFGSTSTPNLNESRQKKQGRQQVRRDRSKSYKEIQKLRIKIATLTSKCEMYRKRSERSKKKQLVVQQNSTPRSKTEAMTRGLNIRKDFKRAILFHNVMCQTLRDKYSTTKCDHEKYSIAKLISSKVMKKYKVMKTCAEQTSISIRRLRKASTVQNEYRSQYKSVSYRAKPVLTAFYERDDNSRITTSKRDTLSRKGVKKQRRLLLSSLKDLHKKFVIENSSMKMSYATFCFLRPFWVVIPAAKDRETCLCKLHENARLILCKLVQLKILPSNCSSVGHCIEDIVCTRGSKECYLRTCANCLMKDRLLLQEFDGDAGVKWQRWTTINENRMIKSKDTVVKRTVKQDVVATVGELIAAYLEIIPSLSLHVFTINHQFNQFRSLKTKSEENVAVIVVDFSENYTCHYNRAVQSSHFGASNNQISLHTGVAYLNNQIVSFCSMSDSTKHEPAAICAHLLPVLRYLRELCPSLAVAHFWSDGPTTQYRNKHHMLLSSHFLYDEGFSAGTWNFFEAGHGKSAADGIGGTLKRIADQEVDHGTVISTAEDFISVLSQKTVIKLFTVSEVNIDSVCHMIPAGIKPIKGTMKLHQIQFIERGIISVRNFSCFCQSPRICECHGSQIVKLGMLQAVLQEDDLSVNQPELDIEDQLMPEIVNQLNAVVSEHPAVIVAEQPAVIVAEQSVAIVIEQHIVAPMQPVAEQPFCPVQHIATEQAVFTAEQVTASDVQSAVTEQDEHIVCAEHPSSLPKLGQWCIVKYDEKCYIGEVTGEDPDNMEIEVSTLTKIGINKFKYPARRDKIWYCFNQIVKVVTTPTSVKIRGKYEFTLNEDDWNYMKD